jgi:thymidylate kinase
MIIILTGTTGSGKSDTAWALMSLHDELVFLESDFLGYRKPFDWRDPSDMKTMFDQLLLNAEFLHKRSATAFVMTLTTHMALMFPEQRSRFEALAAPVYPFRIVCDDEEIERRIRSRDRGPVQQSRELGFHRECTDLMDNAFPDESVFMRVRSTRDAEDDVAREILRRIGEQNN